MLHYVQTPQAGYATRSLGVSEVLTTSPNATQIPPKERRYALLCVDVVDRNRVHHQLLALRLHVTGVCGVTGCGCLVVVRGWVVRLCRQQPA